MLKQYQSHKIVFISFLASVILVFFYVRPLNSPFSPIISGDGFGYYAYLPAKYIYNDTDLKFDWFNEVYGKHYLTKFERADDNFLVVYKGKKINKYYPGLSMLWLPFFKTAHLLAEPLGYKADGFSFPYQAAIALASLIYLLIGLFYLRKLLLLVEPQQYWLSALIPIFLFYGSWLYKYATVFNSLTHVYSFSIITLFIYHALKFILKEKEFHVLIYSVLFLVIAVSIRPLNLISAFVIVPFIKSDYLKIKTVFRNFQIKHISALLLILLFFYNHFNTQFTQTNSFFADSYSNERFYLSNPKLLEVLFSFNAGLFIYCPLFIFVILFLLNKGKRKTGLFLILFLLGIIYLYASWWYWPITTRALIDYYSVFSILILYGVVELSKRIQLFTLFVSLIFAAHFQLKNYQLSHEILDGNLTYFELFKKNYFQIKKVNQYVVPPQTILDSVAFLENLESYPPTLKVTNPYSGKVSGLLDSVINFTKALHFQPPLFLKKSGIKKVRISFMGNFKDSAQFAQLYLYLYDKENKEVSAYPFYINDAVVANSWTLYEFGHEFTEEELLKTDHITWFIWKNGGLGEIWFDDLKTEFLLCDKSYEIVK
ncbi:MAG: hypothetical protein IPM51_02850 [Sphingobacteriaceae bacterium]|nr:hypothetical protein [Sphingobacteriaceae bacterium]